MEVREQLPQTDEFDETAFVETLRSAAVAVGVPLSDKQIAQCVRYTGLLLETNAHTNLTRITEAREVAIKHFADSLTVLRPHPLSPLSLGGERGERGEGGAGVKATLCDVGTGAGFPGIVLKIAYPDLRLTLLDSLQKRLTFLEKVCADLKFPDVQFVHSRAEDGGRNRVLRDGFDIVTARAVAALPTLLEWCTPLVKPGGHFIAMKSGAVEDELATATDAATALKVRLIENRALTLPVLPGSDEPPAERRILVYRKTAPTPTLFPRSSAEIKRKPL
ncbi:MAG: 16S rRNA (guanine(527)-N(7))-methyltransferase RsmG [Fibrella sp.]|nr:16S rRNA (guanine(527)-N(7))-methyltransferase RsmG [Armatimonadota bacterium]